MSGDFRYSDSARYLLGTTFSELGEYDRAIAVFREIEELERDTNACRGSILAGYSCSRRTKDQGTALFNRGVGGGRHASSARRELVREACGSGCVSKLIPFLGFTSRPAAAF